MNPKEYKYTREHEWICPESGNKGKIGITNFAQSHLGDIVFLDLPAVGTQVKKSEKIGEVESVKAVSEFLTPVSGKVLEVNQAAIDEPKLVNDEPYGAGWMVRLEISDASELDDLMNSDEYDEFEANAEAEG